MWPVVSQWFVRSWSTTPSAVISPTGCARGPVAILVAANAALDQQLSHGIRTTSSVRYVSTSIATTPRARPHSSIIFSAVNQSHALRPQHDELVARIARDRTFTHHRDDTKRLNAIRISTPALSAALTQSCCSRVQSTKTLLTGRFSVHNQLPWRHSDATPLLAP